MSKTALVTGAAGFVGRYMVKTLWSAGYDVMSCDPADHSGDAFKLFTDLDDVRFDVVVHAAAARPYRQAIDRQPEIFSYNVALDAMLFRWAIHTEQPHVVYLSSSAVYPTAYQSETLAIKLQESFIDPTAVIEPDATYGWTKLTGERMAIAARKCGVDVTVVRPFSGYGEDQSTDFPFGALIQRACELTDPFTVWGSLEQVRDFIHIDDVCAAILRLIEARPPHPINICTGEGTSLGDLATFIIGRVQKSHPSYIPDLVVDRSAPMGVHRRVGSPDQLKSYYEPRVSLRESVERALRWRGVSL